MDVKPADILSIPYLQAKSEAAAVKQINQLLFPRIRRKKFGAHGPHGDGIRDEVPF